MEVLTKLRYESFMNAWEDTSLISGIYTTILDTSARTESDTGPKATAVVMKVKLH